MHSLETGERKVLIAGGRDARYLATGHLVYVLEGTLLAVPFDAGRLEVTGGPVPVVEGIRTPVTASGAAQLSLSETGSLVYVVAGRREERTLVWVDRQGKEEALTAEPRAYVYPRLSPDGSRLALEVRDQETDIWVWDFVPGTLTRITFGRSRDLYPIWTPDGASVAFASNRNGVYDLYSKAADGTGAVERLTENLNRDSPNAFTPDGSQLVFGSVSGTQEGWDLRVLSLGGSSEPLLATEFNERNAELSPDGQWLAYESNASGQYEIYVRPFPNVDEGQRLISRDGGTRPLWAPDGRELFYLSRGGELMAVRVQTEPSFAPGNAQVVFGGRTLAPAFGRSYDISPDGKRFLMIKEPTRDASSTEIILVQNWFQELERLVPTGPTEP